MGSASVSIGLLLVNAIAGFYLFIVLLRFLLQAARADFYNPISQFTVKATNPFLVPIRKVVPGFWGLDLAALVLAVAVHMLASGLSLLIAGYALNPAAMIVWAVVGIGGLFLKLYFWGILIMVIASWVAPGNYNPALSLLQQILDPIMKPIRKMLPDMGGFDLSPIIALLSIQVLEVIVYAMARETGAPGFVIGL